MDAQQKKIADDFLLSRGVVLVGGVNSGFHPLSSFESPCLVQGKLKPHHQIHVGAYTGIFGGELGPVRIGRFCSIAPDVDIASDQHPIDWLSSSMVQYVNDVHGWKTYLTDSVGMKFESPLRNFNSNASVSIGNDVWIGRSVLIKSGVQIGDGAIVGGGAIVVADVPPYHIVAGNPARIIRPRFNELMIERLIRLGWWDFNIFGVKDINFSKIEDAVDRLEQGIADGTLEKLPITVTSVAEATSVSLKSSEGA